MRLLGSVRFILFIRNQPFIKATGKMVNRMGMVGWFIRISLIIKGCSGTPSRVRLLRLNIIRIVFISFLMEVIIEESS